MPTPERTPAGRALGAQVVDRLAALVALGEAATERRLAAHAEAMDEVAQFLGQLPLHVPRGQAVQLAAGLLGLTGAEAAAVADQAADLVAQYRRLPQLRPPARPRPSLAASGAPGHATAPPGRAEAPRARRAAA